MKLYTFTLIGKMDSESYWVQPMPDVYMGTLTEAGLYVLLGADDLGKEFKCIDMACNIYKVRELEV